MSDAQCFKNSKKTVPQAGSFGAITMALLTDGLGRRGREKLRELASLLFCFSPERNVRGSQKDDVDRTKASLTRVGC